MSYQLFGWERENISSMKFFDVPNQDFVDKEQIQYAIIATGKQKYYTFILENKVNIKTKVFLTESYIVIRFK